MNAIIPTETASDRMQTTGNILLCLAASGLVGTLLLAFLVANSSAGNSDGLIPAIARAIGQYFRFVTLITLTSEVLAILVLVLGAARWRFRIIRSPRWVISALCTAFVGLAMIILVSIAALICTYRI
jgi:uncharacterized membrane protein